MRAALTGNGHLTGEWSFLNRKIREVTGDFLYERTKRRPMILPMVMEV